MHAIIETGGKQYKVTEGDTLLIEKLEPRPDRPSPSISPGHPGRRQGYLRRSRSGGRFRGRHCGEERQGQEGPDLQVQSKKGYRKRQGHRQPYTKVQIGAIQA